MSIKSNEAKYIPIFVFGMYLCGSKSHYAPPRIKIMITNERYPYIL